jgi:hypothetical protein
MTTSLTLRISTVEEAKSLLLALFNNGEAFHPEDDATDIDIFTHSEGEQLNKLMADIYRKTLESL